MDLLVQGGDSVVLERDFGVAFGDLPKAIVIERVGNEIMSLEVLEGICLFLCPCSRSFEGGIKCCPCLTVCPFSELVCV